MTREKIVFIIMTMLLPLSLTAQKKQLSQARDILKEGKSPEKAEALMNDLLKDSTYRDNIKVWNILFSAQTMKYEQYNEKQYLQKEQDTVALFSTAREMFRTALTIDSLECMPDKKGRVQPRLRQHHSAYLHVIRPNLFNGGIYAIKQRKYQDAITFFEQYIDCSRQPLFAAYDYEHTDRYLAQAAYWAMFSSSQLGYDDDVLVYSRTAVGDTVHTPYILQYRAEAFLHKCDTVAYVAELTKGFEQYPLHPYFFPRLVEYHEQSRKYDEAMLVVERALDADSTSMLFRYAKSNVCLNMKRYDECIAICDQLIEEDTSIAETYYNAGLAYFNKAIEVEKQMMSGTYSRTQRRKYQEQKEKFYRKSLDYLQTYRSLAPEKQAQWTLPLYTIYLNLNMGKEFEEIEKLRK